MEDKVFENKKQGIALNSVFEKTKKNITDTLYKLIVFGIIIAIWHVGAKSIGSSLLLPMPIEVAKGFIQCITDPEIVKNVMITMSRVLKGFTYAMAIGLPLGIIMGFSKTVEKAISPVVDSARQIPIMSWVPLTIVWFGIGDGPTVFLIGFSSIFPIILNTIQGIRSISKDYYNAARSMGASPLTIFTNVMLPAALPDILTGARIGIGIGWMSVIWAEFIATSAGIGYSMVQAQTLMRTELLMGLMLFTAFIGFLIDRVLKFINFRLCKWKFTN